MNFSDPQALRLALLKAALLHVPFDGWGARSLILAARDLGVEPSLAQSVFPGGAVDMIDLHQALADQELVAAMLPLQTAGMRVRDRIALGVRMRLEPYTQQRDIVRSGLASLLVPPHGLAGMRQVYRTVDTIWRIAGDRATDYNFYTKRGLLAGVYLSTLLYWLNDSSDDCMESWGFLQRRIDDALRLPGNIKKLREGPRLWRDLASRLQRPRYYS